MKMFIWIDLIVSSLVCLALLNGEAYGKCEITSYIDDNVKEYYADCSFLNLTDLPTNLPANITCLNMIGNKIAHFDSTSLQRYRYLRKLSLARNIIETLNGNNFKGLSKLEMLDLSLNHIRYNTMHENVFKPLSSLIYLDIKQNLSNIWPNEHYPEGLKYLIRLETLVIDGIGSQALPKLSNLIELYMSGVYGRCDIPYIHGDLFENIMGVRNIFLSNCSIMKVDYNSFKILSNITSLDMSWNINLGMESVPNITSGLAGSQTLKRLNLNTLYDHSVFDFCSSLSIDFIKYLSNTTLELLTVENNNLVRIDVPSVFNWPKSIKFISVQHNMFLYGNYTPLLILSGVLNNLIYVDISRMSAANRPIFEYNVDKMKPLFQASTTHSSFSQLDNTSYFITICESMFTRKQVSDYFQETEIRLQQNHIDGDNVIEDKEAITLSKSKLEYLDLTENLPVLIERFFEIFPYIPNLKVLNISKNYLGYPIFNNIDIFGQLKNVRTLDLRGNRIVQLKPSIFNNLTKLENLYMSHNSISNISFDLRNSKNLSYLDLEYNNLEFMDIATLKLFDELPNVVINVANNNLKCLCEHIHFFLWIKENRNKILKLEETMCTFPNSSKMSIANIDYERFSSQCSDYYVIIMVSASLVLIIFVSAVSALIHKYNANIRVIYKRITVHFPFIYDDNNDINNKNIYVINDVEENDFVSEIKSQLENLGVEVHFIIEDEEFQSQFIFRNVGMSLLKSRKTLIVLTNNCIRSLDCSMRINMAIMDKIASKCRKQIIVIKKGNFEIPVELIGHLMDILEYPSSETDRIGFWSNLKDNLINF